MPGRGRARRRSRCRVRRRPGASPRRRRRRRTTTAVHPRSSTWGCRGGRPAGRSRTARSPRPRRSRHRRACSRRRCGTGGRPWRGRRRWAPDRGPTPRRRRPRQAPIARRGVLGLVEPGEGFVQGGRAGAGDGHGSTPVGRSSAASTRSESDRSPIVRRCGSGAHLTRVGMRDDVVELSPLRVRCQVDDLDLEAARRGARRRAAAGSTEARNDFGDWPGDVQAQLPDRLRSWSSRPTAGVR